jgi:hypothetical protein
MEFDQPEERDEVSLAELLGEEQPAEGQGEEQEGATAAHTPTRATPARRPLTKSRKRYSPGRFLTGHSVSAPLVCADSGARTAEELAIARTIRQRYQGKSVAEIEEA